MNRLADFITPAQIEVAEMTFAGHTARNIGELTNRAKKTVYELRRRGRRRLERAGFRYPDPPPGVSRIVRARSAASA